MELSRMEYRKLVADVAAEVVRQVLPFIKKGKRPEDECTWIKTSEAAAILGISVDHLYDIKDSFTHIKTGNGGRSGSLRFRKETLLDEHMASHKFRDRIPAARKEQEAERRARKAARKDNPSDDNHAASTVPPRGPKIGKFGAFQSGGRV